MTTTYTKESSISEEKARAILTSLGCEDDYCSGDWFLCWDADGREYLALWGIDEPVAENRGTTSWASPGYPA